MDRFLLKIDPPQPCQGSYPDGKGDEKPCTLLTGLAEAEHESGCERQLRVMPYCWRHLYMGWPEPTPEQLALEHWCVANFVINELGGGKGTAQVLGACPPDSIPPPYEPWEDEEFIDEAWYVTYRGEDGKARHVCAVYLVWENWWELYPFPEAQHTSPSNGVDE